MTTAARSSVSFDDFVRTDGERLRRVMAAQHGIDVGADAANSALAWAWENWERVAPMENAAGYLYRVAAYRQPLDEALEQNPAPSSTTIRRGHSHDGNNVAVLNPEPEEAVKASRWPTYAMAAACLALIAGAGLLFVNRTDPTSGISSNSFDETTPVACPQQAGTPDVGDPAPDLDFDNSQFLVALPADTPPRALAVRALLDPAAGAQCIAFDPASIATTLDQSNGAVTATLHPPAAGNNLELRLTIARTTDLIGVTRINGLTPFEVDQSNPTATLNLAGDLPARASEIDVTFRVGTDIVNITAPLDQAQAIPLTATDGSIGPDENPV